MPRRLLRPALPADSLEAFRQAQASAQQEVGAVETHLAAVTLQVEGEKGPVTVTQDSPLLAELRAVISPDATDAGAPKKL